MNITILSGAQIVEGIVGAIMLCFLEYVLHKGRMTWRDAKVAGLIFLGTWCCRKFAVHIYNSLGGFNDIQPSP